MLTWSTIGYRPKAGHTDVLVKQGKPDITVKQRRRVGWKTRLAREDVERPWK